jgi:hemerythrin superfamily protein
MDQMISRRDLGLAAVSLLSAGSIGFADTAAASSAMDAESGGDWLATIKAQHAELDHLLAAVKAAGSGEARIAAFKKFSIYLSAHSMAEETTVYPALAITGSEAASKQLYTEQDAAKVLVARIDDALSGGDGAEVPAVLDTLGNALHAHVAEEENQYFPPLKARENATMNAKLSTEFSQAFRRASA